jgi:hypothetical protein
MKPNFTQGSVIQSLERENQYLRAQSQAMAQTSRLIEAAVTGLAARLTSPKEIAEQAVQIAGAVITELDRLSAPEPA